MSTDRTPQVPSRRLVDGRRIADVSGHHEGGAASGAYSSGHLSELVDGASE
jgi:hypothetical protein